MRRRVRGAIPKINREKDGQQEMVGFVLIVVIVMIGMMVFLIISLRTSDEDSKSLEVEYLIGSVMKYTTGCTVSSIKFEDFESLFKSCYRNKRCENLGKSACEYLNSSFRDVMKVLLESEARISDYQLEFFEKGDGGNKGLLMIEGNCSSGLISSAQRTLISNSESLIIRLKLCKDI